MTLGVSPRPRLMLYVIILEVTKDISVTMGLIYRVHLTSHHMHTYINVRIEPPSCSDGILCAHVREFGTTAISHVISALLCVTNSQILTMGHHPECY